MWGTARMVDLAVFDKRIYYWRRKPSVSYLRHCVCVIFGYMRKRWMVTFTTIATKAGWNVMRSYIAGMELMG